MGRPGGPEYLDAASSEVAPDEQRDRDDDEDDENLDQHDPSLLGSRNVPGLIKSGLCRRIAFHSESAEPYFSQPGCSGAYMPIGLDR